MKRTFMAGGLAIALALFATVSWSDVAMNGSGSSPSSGSSLPSSVVGAAALGEIPYSDLSPDEQMVVDSVRNEVGWDQTNDTFAAAGRELATRAAADSSAQQIGMSGLGEQGVIP